jgi:hypothetical protein
MTKVELEMEANAFPFQALVWIERHDEVYLWRPGKLSKSEGSGSSGEKLHPVVLSIKLIPWKMLRITRTRCANS